MRSTLTPTCTMAIVAAFAAQMQAFAQANPQTAAGVVGTKPRQAQTAPVRPVVQTPADTANAMAQTERVAIQSDLAWVGQYNGAINGEVSERMVAAIKTFQKDNGGKPTGVLNLQERGVLVDAARKLQNNVGWKLTTDPVTGARIGLPTKLVPQQSSDANGSRWSSSTGTIQIMLARRKEEAPSTARLAEQEKKQDARKIEYSAIKPDFFVLSGMQGLKKFYVRGQFRENEVRILTILYDQATEGTMEPVTIAMSSAFNPFPSGAQAAGPAPRKNVEYGTGIVVSHDAVLTDRQTVDGCMSIVIGGYGNADRGAEDKTRDLALLRIYGARGLKPLNVSGSTTKPTLEFIGIADPQNQAGGNAVSSVRSMVAPSPSGELTLSPAPGLGFSGAPAIDTEGKFAGVAQLRPAAVAGPPNVAAASQAVLVSADDVRGFLKSNDVTTSGTLPTDIKASVVRVICVRK